jgi:hypothetical protein
MSERRKRQIQAVLDVHGTSDTMISRPNTHAVRHNVKLDVEKVAWARSEKKRGSTFTSIANSLGVSRTAVREAVLGYTWDSVEK